MRNAVQENIQEHSHMVAVLSHTLAVIRRDVLGVDCDPGAAAVAALYHDAPEIFTGDLPTPVKYCNPEIRDAYKAVEAVSADKLLSMLPPSCAPPTPPGCGRTTTRPSGLVKAADKLSAHIKCVEEVKAGNNEFRQAAGQTLEAVEAMGLPEVPIY